DERRDYWQKSDLEPTIKARLIQDSHQEVQRFFAVVEQALLPALAKGDRDAAAKAYAEITKIYQAHRAIIDDIVKKTKDGNAAFEAGATQRVTTFTIIMWVISGVVFLIIGGGLLAVGLGVIRPMTGMTNVMARLAGGSLDIEIPLLHRQDEVGAMARAVQIFRENAARVQAMETAQADMQLKAARDRKVAMDQVADAFD